MPLFTNHVLLQSSKWAIESRGPHLKHRSHFKIVEDGDHNLSHHQGYNRRREEAPEVVEPESVEVRTETNHADG